MKILNRHGLPEPIVKAVTHDLHPRQGFSVTDLIQPPRMTQLIRRHYDEIEVDVADRIWSLLGLAIHSILERSEVPDSQREQTLAADVDGTTVRGTIDLTHNSVLTDYKITSAWSMIFEPEGRADWHSQLNLYRWLRMRNGLPTTKLQVCALLRDWQQSKANDPDYPPIPVVIVDIPIWPDAEVEAYVRRRVALHLAAQDLDDDRLPLCTPEERWDKPTSYAIVAPRHKSAIRVFQMETDARAWLSANYNTSYRIEVRPGRRVRCEGYCDCQAWCSQYREYKAASTLHDCDSNGTGSGLPYAMPGGRSDTRCGG